MYHYHSENLKVNWVLIKNCNPALNLWRHLTVVLHCKIIWKYKWAQSHYTTCGPPPSPKFCALKNGQKMTNSFFRTSLIESSLVRNLKKCPACTFLKVEPWAIVMAPSAMSSSYAHHQHPVLWTGLPPSTPRPMDGAASVINTPSYGRGRLHHQHPVLWTGQPPSSKPRPMDGAACHGTH